MNKFSLSCLEVQGTNIFSALEEFGLKSKLLEGDGSWCVVAQAKRNSPVIPITAKQGPNNVDLAVTISLGMYLCFAYIDYGKDDGDGHITKMYSV